MKTRRILLVLGLLLILGGALWWKFSASKEVSPTTKSTVASLPNALTKPIASSPALAVVAPKAAPVVGPDKPPAEFTPEDRKWVDGYIQADERSAADIGVGAVNDRLMATAPDDAARARIAQFQKNYAAGLLKQADLLRHAKPPEDLGEIPIASLPEAPGMTVPANAPRYVLPGGEIFTVTLFYTNWWSLLITEEIPGQSGKYAGQYFHQLAIGQPTILMMQDGALAKFTLVGNMPDAPTRSNNPRMGFSGAAGMGRNPAAQ